MQPPVAKGGDEEDQENDSPSAKDVPDHISFFLYPFSLLSLISKRDADGPRGADHAASRIDQSRLAHCLIDRNGFNLARSQANHVVEIPAGNQLDGFDTEARRQDSVKRTRRSPALNVAQHTDPHFFA